jgi:hypothetical protein
VRKHPLAPLSDCVGSFLELGDLTFGLGVFFCLVILYKAAVLTLVLLLTLQQVQEKNFPAR